ALRVFIAEDPRAAVHEEHRGAQAGAIARPVDVELEIDAAGLVKYDVSNALHAAVPHRQWEQALAQAPRLVEAAGQVRRNAVAVIVAEPLAQCRLDDGARFPRFEEQEE